MAADAGSLQAQIKVGRASGQQRFELDVELQVPPGITILFGPSGAGKSTLLDAISGLLRPREARITLGDAVLQDSSSAVFLPPRKREIAYLFQAPALFPHMTVKGNAEFGLRGKSDREKLATATDLLDMFRVGHLKHRRPGEISGG